MSFMPLKTVLALSLLMLSYGSLAKADTILNIPGVGETAGFYPLAHYLSIETDHFRIAFTPELEPVARKSAQYLEEAYGFMTRELRWTPWYKAQVVLVDNADSANGFSAATLRIGLVLYVTPPDNWSSLYNYDDWLRLLIFHEYTHFVNMDTTNSWLYKLIRIGSGDGFLPNALWAPWMLEGLAVYMETRTSTAGRGRSSYLEMILRAAVEENALDQAKFITLDKITADNPYFPAGEIPYLFGYGMMNQVAQDSLGPRTADGESSIENGEEALGEISLRSAGRVPYFINGNQENITGKSWYDYWDIWVGETRERQNKSLKKIHAQAVTPVEHLTSRAFGVLGNAVSPDGKWVAYTQESLDRRIGVYVRDTASGATRRLDDKLLGVGMAFTPDSRTLVMSALRRRSPFFLYSDLAAYNLETDHWQWLSTHLRLRDPDISRDGKQIVFTQTETATTGLSMASLEGAGDELKIGPIRKLYFPPMYDRVSNPKFTADASSIVLTLHRNGSSEEELARFDIASGELTTLVRNGHYNRFPSLDHAGNIYIVSDLTGVDNMYRVIKNDGESSIEQVTNVTTGFWLPTFAPNGTVYGSVLSSTGWDLARLQVASKPYRSAELTILPPVAPKLDALSLPKSPGTAGIPAPASVSVENYSPWHSLLPRLWVPRLYLQNNGLYFGETLLGFDAVDRHRYLLDIAYDTLVQKPDWLAVYNNRSLGPTLSVLAQNLTSASTTYLNGSLASYIRTTEFSAQASYNFRRTFAVLTPIITVNASRAELFKQGLVVDTSYYVPSADIRLGFSNVETTSLGISPESGFQSVAAFRTYFDHGSPLYKGLLNYRRYDRLAPHTILVPSIQATSVSHTSPYFAGGNVELDGRVQRFLRDVPGTNLDGMGIRGYPGQSYFVRQAATGALDLRFPLARIFRGWGTNPAFLDNLSGFVFGESTWFPFQELGTSFLSSAGGGLKLGSTLFHRVPLDISVQYQYGFNLSLGGGSEVFATVNLGALPF